jgi:membrane peptidoglycan carboxypeptidase
VNVAQIAPRPKQVLWGLAGAIVVAGVLAGVAYARTTIPTPSAIASAQTTTIYYSDGKTVLAQIGTTNRTDVPLSAVPIAVQHAVLAAEDRHFYSEPGVSPTGIVRALAVDLRGGDISQGGSTITQQYAKNAYLSPHRSLSRKIKEIFIATKLGQTRPKDAILGDYLNTIYFGRDAYGIQAAAKAYFNVDVADLTTAQGALLAAVIRGPSLYDPAISKTTKAAAVARWHYVVDGMVSQGWLTQQEAAQLRFPKTNGSTNGAAQCTGTKCFIRDAVEHELTTSDGLSQAQLDLGGYKIVTTIRVKAQGALRKAERTVLPKNNSGTPESGAASIEPGNGAIEALYGGRTYCHDPKKNKDACIDLSGFTGQWARPPGSSFKAFTLLAALQKGISLNSVFNGPPEVNVDGFTIHNSSPGESCYGCTLTKAFAQSINTIFVPLAQQVGPQNVVNAAYLAGIPKFRKLSAVPDISLGPDSVSPVDLANAYATIAAQGIHADPYLVSSVTTNTGLRIYKATPHLTRVFPATITADETYAMTKVLAPGGTAYGHALLDRPSAGKTGTTDSNTNAWFTGFTPQLCTSVWIGNVDSAQTVEGAGIGEVFGGTLPAEIWQQSMDAALAGEPALPFPPAANGGTPQGNATPSTSPSATPTATATVTVSPTPTPTITPTTPPPSTPPPTTSPTNTPTESTTPTASSTATSATDPGLAGQADRTRRRTRP